MAESTSLEQSSKTELNRILHLAERMTVASSVNRQVLFQLAKAPIEALLKIGQENASQKDLWKQGVAALANHLLTLRNQQDRQILADRSDSGGECPSCESFLNKKSGKKNFASQPGKHPSADATKADWYFFCPRCVEPIESSINDFQNRYLTRA